MLVRLEAQLSDGAAGYKAMYGSKMTWSLFKFQLRGSDLAMDMTFGGMKIPRIAHQSWRKIRFGSIPTVGRATPVKCAGRGLRVILQNMGGVPGDLLLM